MGDQRRRRFFCRDCPIPVDGSYNRPANGEAPTERQGSGFSRRPGSAPLRDAGRGAAGRGYGERAAAPRAL